MCVEGVAQLGFAYECVADELESLESQEKDACASRDVRLRGVK